jgi:transcriptional regulator with XRE-family HTH domain
MSKNTDILKKFGKRVREIRLQKGITSQITLANKAGLDRTYIGGVERGERFQNP